MNILKLKLDDLKNYKYKNNQVLPVVREDVQETYHVDVFTKERHYGGFGDNFIDETTHYKNDIKHGQYSRRNERGDIMFKCHYQEGLKHGEEIYYDTDFGTVIQQCSYFEGKLDGEFNTYNDCGELQYRCYYDKGVKKINISNFVSNFFRFIFVM